MMPQPESSLRHVFVYGTLRAGGSNDIARMRPAPRRVGVAEVRGTLYDLGPYPGLRCVGGDLVFGEVYSIDSEVERALDVLEDVRHDGSGEYLKRLVMLKVGEQFLNCLMYEIQADRIAGRPVIESGDWIAHLLTRPSVS